MILDNLQTCVRRARVVHLVFLLPTQILAVIVRFKKKTIDVNMYGPSENHYGKLLLGMKTVHQYMA